MRRPKSAVTYAGLQGRLLSWARDTELFRRSFGQARVLQQPSCALLPFFQKGIRLCDANGHQGKATIVHQLNEIGMLCTSCVGVNQFCNDIVRRTFWRKDAKE